MSLKISAPYVCMYIRILQNSKYELLWEHPYNNYGIVIRLIFIVLVHLFVCHFF